VSFAEWQASRGILPWTRVHEIGIGRPGLAMARFGCRLRHQAPRIGASFAALGNAAIGAAIRTAHFVEMTEHQLALAALEAR
jgi:hypothetical protein